MVEGVGRSRKCAHCCTMSYNSAVGVHDMHSQTELHGTIIILSSAGIVRGLQPEAMSADSSISLFHPTERFSSYGGG